MGQRAKEFEKRLTNFFQERLYKHSGTAAIHVFLQSCESEKEMKF